MKSRRIFTRPARIAAIAPYLWMVLVFLVPFGFVLKISLSETVIEGINTNVPLHAELMVDANFVAGGTNIHYLEEWLSQHKR